MHANAPAPQTSIAPALSFLYCGLCTRVHEMLAYEMQDDRGVRPGPAAPTENK